MRMKWLSSLSLAAITALAGISAAVNATTPSSLAAAGFATDDERNSMQIFEHARPSVVFVTNQQVMRDPRSYDLMSVPAGSGTGFVWGEQGYIVTNFHVVQNANKVMITLQDQSSWFAEVVGLAPERDLAVLKIAAPKEKLVALALGDSSSLSVGRKVLAIGNPFGLDATLTTGVVSALGRDIISPNQRKISGVIQTDAAINPGNSGGPLLNSQGQLIGVNTMIYSPSGASAGIGFAIPVNTLKDVIPQLIKHGRIIRPVMGLEPAPDQWTQQSGIEGVAILRVFPNSPAQEAGLQGIMRNSWGQLVLGDVIVAIDGKLTPNNDQLMGALENYKPGDKIEIHLMRDGKIIKRFLTLIAPAKT
ncbi:MAG: trypsin-like peptidase domain-containing protein [Pseudomonadota bacterium]